MVRYSECYWEVCGMKRRGGFVEVLGAFACAGSAGEQLLTQDIGFAIGRDTAAQLRLRNERGCFSVREDVEHEDSFEKRPPN